ncbi:TPA: hypothetical protein N0F65_004975 [Lagenidium giganteum]|uniref:Elicitor-like transglutaminase n=1 Tax=Lagenidium giganteum TaxID=4803 RepID=A0AAV2ZHU3_9STRA|nr:TPA: hypothetical protein N0F65_004975 [Lagenidium giganteum]
MYTVPSPPVFAKTAMVLTPTRVLGCFTLAAIAARTTHAAPLEFAPFMEVPVGAPLDRSNPAYGGPTRGAVAPVIMEAPVISPEELAVYESAPVNGTDDSESDARLRLRRLEVGDKTNADIKKLEEYFGVRMERNADVLKQYSSSDFKPAPWPSSYWPTYADGINYRWQDAPSASEKYAMAFGKDVKEFTDTISKNNGILSMTHSRKCSSDSQCDSGEKCGKRRGESSGYCIAGWFGICHAWAPAAILEPEPQCAVKYNGVKFDVFDMKALMTQIYDGSGVGTVFTGARYDGGRDPTDAYGRFKDAAHRDLGPGYMHIAMTNVMGKLKKTFVLDVEPDAPVWNQPVRSFKILKTKDYTPRDATKVFFGFRNSPYPFNNEAKRLRYVENEVKWIVEAGEDGPLVSTGRVNSYTTTRRYEYLLELDNDNNILGGEWTQKTPSPSQTQQTPSPSQTQQTPTPSQSQKTPSPSQTQQTPSPSQTQEIPLPSQSQKTPSPGQYQKTTSPAQQQGSSTGQQQQEQQQQQGWSNGDLKSSPAGESTSNDNNTSNGTPSAATTSAGKKLSAVTGASSAPAQSSTTPTGQSAPSANTPAMTPAALRIDSSMVSTPSRLVGFAAVVAAIAHTANAAPLEYNSYMEVPVGAPLDEFSPAYGMPTVNAVAPVILEAPEESVEAVSGFTPGNETELLFAGRRLESGTNSDIQKLEQYFGARMERNYKTIGRMYSRASHTPVPWPGSYWPVYQDGINARFRGEKYSATEKYARAFGKDPKKLMDAVSAKSGILSQSDSRSCRYDDQCSRGEKCGIRDGESAGHCIAGWFGVCHAWAPAAIMEPGPECPVKYNGMTFGVRDIKALITQVYDGAGIGSVFTGARFDGGDKSTDSYGRYRDGALRDLGPGYFHIALANIMGRFKQSMVLDVDAEAPVWNQPVRGYADDSSSNRPEDASSNRRKDAFASLAVDAFAGDSGNAIASLAVHAIACGSKSPVPSSTSSKPVPGSTPASTSPSQQKQQKPAPALTPESTNPSQQQKPVPSKATGTAPTPSGESKPNASTPSNGAAPSVAAPVATPAATKTTGAVPTQSTGGKQTPPAGQSTPGANPAPTPAATTPKGHC